MSGRQYKYCETVGMSTQVLFLKVVYYIAGKQSRVIGCSEREFFLDPRLTVDRPTSLFRLPCFPTDLCLFVSPVIPELTCVSELRARDVSVYHTYGWRCVCALTQRGGTPATNYTFNWSISVGCHRKMDLPCQTWGSGLPID